MRHNGFTLIEVLIAVFVLAIGILGVAGLQLFAKQSSYDAVQRTTAATLASGIVERMRMNPVGINSYIADAEPVNQATAVPNTCTAAATCTPQQLAAHDLQLWYSNIIGNSETLTGGNSAGGLVAPSACIRQVAGTDNQYEIAIAWRGRSALSNPVDSNCGQGAPAGTYGANNEYRRLFVIEATIE